MRTFADIIDALGGSASVAHGIGLMPGTVRQMRRRGRIPPEYWPALVDFALARGVMDVTLTVLASLAARKRPEVVRDLREQGRAA
jgi:hypothetical protein